MGHYRANVRDLDRNPPFLAAEHTVTGTVVENVDTDVMDVADNVF